MITAEPMVTAPDSPRTRCTDPAASHLAGDRSQRGLSDLRVAILWMLSDVGPVTGVRANEVYGEWLRETDGLPGCAFDSPRKRLGELADDGFVDVVAHNHGTLEAVYALSPEGRRYLEGLSDVSAA
jgi:DNA-binding HxlR family transcriptional regulator